MTTFTRTLRTGLLGRDFLRIDDMTRTDLEQVLDLAAAIKQDPSLSADAFPGRTLAMYFNKPSTRTRVSFVEAAHHLGLFPLTLGPQDLQLSRGETLADTARTLSQYAAAIVVRTFAHENLEELARYAEVPVVNALTDDHHPCQALADALTIREEFGSVDGIHVAFIGDFNNVARSLSHAVTLLGGHLIVATPDELRPHQVTSLPPAARGTIAFTNDVGEAVAGADVVYTDVWSSMGDKDPVTKSELLRSFQVDAAVMKEASSRAVFMHCLPAHRGEEVTDDVIDGPTSVVWDQAFNRLPTEEAVLLGAILRHPLAR